MKVHIGNEIRKFLEKNGTKASWLAEQINTSERNIYSLLKRKEISTDQLAEISSALGFNFFSLYEKTLKNVPAAEEPPMLYKLNRKVAVTVELDGTEETLEDWYSMLKKFNAAL